MVRLKAFLGRPPAERRLLLAAGIALTGVRVALWVLTFDRLRRLLAPLRRVREGTGAEPTNDELAGAIVRAVQSSSRHVPGATCLVRALAAQILLARHGYASRLQIGVARDRVGSFEAHAWLERNGRVLVGNLADLARYSVLPPLPGENL